MSGQENSKSYKPLPNYITIGKSHIHGLGLIATKDILSDVRIGPSHYLVNGVTIRTPLGGFGNHSLYPTCEKIFDGGVNCWYIFTLEDITAGEELTWKYSFYTP